MTCSTFKCCRLYSWMRLTWMSNSAVRIDGDAGALDDQSRRARSLFASFTARQRSRNAGSSACGSSPRSASRSVIQPSPIVSSSSVAAAGSRARGSAAASRRWSRCRTARATARRSRAARSARSRLRVQRRDAVDVWLPTIARLRHPDLLVAVLARSATCGATRASSPGSARAPRRESGG